MGKEFWQRKLMEKLEKEGLVDRRIMEDFFFRHKDDDAEMEETEKDFDNEIEENVNGNHAYSVDDVEEADTLRKFDYNEYDESPSNTNIDPIEPDTANSIEQMDTNIDDNSVGSDDKINITLIFTSLLLVFLKLFV